MANATAGHSFDVSVADLRRMLYGDVTRRVEEGDAEHEDAFSAAARLLSSHSSDSLFCHPIHTASALR